MIKTCISENKYTKEESKRNIYTTLMRILISITDRTVRPYVVHAQETRKVLKRVSGMEINLFLKINKCEKRWNIASTVNPMRFGLEMKPSSVKLIGFNMITSAKGLKLWVNHVGGFNPIAAHAYYNSETKQHRNGD